MILPGKALVGDLSGGGVPRICCVGYRGYVAWVAEDMCIVTGGKQSQLQVLVLDFSLDWSLTIIIDTLCYQL